MKFVLYAVLLPFILYSCFAQPTKRQVKMNGVSLVSPPNPIEESDFKGLMATQSNWVSIIPYGFSPGHKPVLHFDHERQWWGEKPEGIVKLIEFAQSSQLKIMLKPHVWVLGDGWTGEFRLENDKDWLQWEEQYMKYILTYARICETYHVDLFCIGTEYRKVVVLRPDFWSAVIEEVRKIYSGPITYAANWDNYHKVGFWSQLDYIGIDAYFPLSDEQNPSTETLIEAWKDVAIDLNKLSSEHDKPLLFTEYGYKSCDYATAGHWITDAVDQDFNAEIQVNAYQALYQVFWGEPWFKGGFLWKWFPYDDSSLNQRNTEFTPQNKKVLAIIKEQYKTYK